MRQGDVSDAASLEGLGSDIDVAYPNTSCAAKHWRKSCSAFYFQAAQKSLECDPAQGGAESGSDGGRGRTLPTEDEEIDVWAQSPPVEGS